MMYPITIVRDYYEGKYSGGSWTAWNKMYGALPVSLHGPEELCAGVWKKMKEEEEVIGLGDSPEEAYMDLKIKMKRKDARN